MNNSKVNLLPEKFIPRVAEILSTEYDSPESIQETQEFIRKRLGSKECYGAILGNELAGFFIYWRDYSHYANYLSDIFVLKEYRRMGVAKALLEKFVEISKKEQPKKQRYALSSTKVSNEASIKMHTSFGFENIGIIKNLHYGEDEIFFGYDLRKK